MRDRAVVVAALALALELLGLLVERFLVSPGVSRRTVRSATVTAG